MDKNAHGGVCHCICPMQSKCMRPHEDKVHYGKWDFFVVNLIQELGLAATCCFFVLVLFQIPDHIQGTGYIHACKSLI